MFLFNLYHQIVKQNTSISKPFSDPEEWPDSWKTTFVKVYERFPLIGLPSPSNEIQPSLSKALSLRTTKRNFGKHITTQIISDLLYYSMGVRNDLLETQEEHRMYPSGGTRYPLEFYLFFF